MAVMVALTLLILTIQDPRVGPALRMDSEIFLKTSFNSGKPPPTQFVCNDIDSEARVRALGRRADLFAAI